MCGARLLCLLVSAGALPVLIVLQHLVEALGQVRPGAVADHRRSPVCSKLDHNEAVCFLPAACVPDRCEQCGRLRWCCE
jgi:hypothetical protein